MRNRIRKFLSGEIDGSTVTEFAMIAPIFLFVVFSIIESSVFFIHRHTLRYVVFESTRDIQTGEIQRSSDPEAAFKTAYCSHTPAFIDCSEIQIDVRSFAKLSDVSFEPLEFDEDGKVKNLKFLPGKQEQITMVTAAMRYNFNTPGLKKVFQNDGEPVVMVGYSIAKNEPFGCVDDC